jgi:hypothetical protein
MGQQGKICPARCQCLPETICLASAGTYTSVYNVVSGTNPFGLSARPQTRRVVDTGRSYIPVG